MPKLSIVIPAYNEGSFIGELLELVLRVPVEKAGFEKEVIVVNDGSKDDTGQVARSVAERSEGRVLVFHQTPNQGKGKAVRRGIAECTGDFILIQDADLEYDPNDYLPMLEALRGGAGSVYGSRVLGQCRLQKGFTLFPGRHPGQGLGPWMAGVFLTAWTFLLYGRWITDTLTAYKLYPADVMKSMSIHTTGFETDHEITAKLIRRGKTIAEVPISYRPRSVEQGKKIKARDGFVAVWTLLKYRFVE
jgi:glycosyltransferase involved in cell wall biosynthesis